MAHHQQDEFIRIVKAHLPQFFTDSRVIEIGSLDINGSVRAHFDTTRYLGCDLRRGAGVDLDAPGQLIGQPTGSFDVALSLECFEHNPYWLETFVNMLRLTREGGMVLFTCATTGRREHGTPRSAPESSPFTVERGWTYYRNLTKSDFTSRLDLSLWLSDWRFYVGHESYDLYFVGLRSGAGAAKLPPQVDLLMHRRFRAFGSLKSGRHFIKTLIFGDFWSSPLSYYLRGKR